MQADDVFGAFRCVGNFVDIQRRSICRQDGVFLTYLVEFAEYFLLDRHIFEHGFNDKIDIAQVVIALAGSESVEAIRHLRFADLAALDAAFIKASNSRFTALESFVVVVEQDEFATGIQATVGNSGAHRAGTDNGD